MEFYGFLRGLLAWTASVACLWPVNIPLLFLAHRVREGRPLEGSEDDDTRMDNEEVWTRAALGALALAGLTLVFLFADLVLADWADLPAGIVHLIIVLGYFPSAAYLLQQFFTYDDYFFGVSLLALYLGLPIFVLYPLNWLIGFWNPWLRFIGSWLKEIPV